MRLEDKEYKSSRNAKKKESHWPKLALAIQARYVGEEWASAPQVL